MTNGTDVPTNSFNNIKNKTTNLTENLIWWMQNYKFENEKNKKKEAAWTQTASIWQPSRTTQRTSRMSLKSCRRALHRDDIKRIPILMSSWCRPLLRLFNVCGIAFWVVLNCYQIHAASITIFSDRIIGQPKSIKRFFNLVFESSNRANEIVQKAF